MDARLHPEQFLGLQLGDAHVIRNAGGRVSEDAIRSLAISERLLGTEEIVVVHHTGMCVLPTLYSRSRTLCDSTRRYDGSLLAGISKTRAIQLEQNVMQPCTPR